ncbi:MAG: HAD family hydrolase [Thaumarchaeota archaeon]|nr:HAD family hydrolase [Nitrososphaerota archaeon]
MAVAVIFDVDGTLVTFTFDVRGTRAALIEELSRRGYDTAGLDLSTPTQRILDAASSQRHDGGERAYEELRMAVFAILDRYEVESAASTSPFPGIVEVLRHLRSSGVRLAVLTNSGRRAASEALSRAGIEGFFEFVLTRDDTELMKPRPEGLIMAASRFGLPRGSISYVGDSLYDIAAAKGAGIRMISVATGNYSVERLRSEGADSVITSISDLPRALGV